MKNEALVALIEVYYDDPVAFAEDMLGFTPDGWQQIGRASCRERV